MSRHTIVVGITESGKSLYLKAMATKAADQGHKVVVFDPTLSSDWPATAIKYGDAELFLTDSLKTRTAYVFIDEAADLWNFDQASADKVLYRGRHQGLAIFIAGQRLTMIRPNARNMCSRLVAFRQTSDDDARALRDWHIGMTKALSLAPCEGLATDGYNIQKITVAWDPPRVIVHPDKAERPSDGDFKVSDHSPTDDLQSADTGVE